MKASELETADRSDAEAVKEPLGNPNAKRLLADDLRGICIEAGAYDAGFVEIGREAFDKEREGMLRVYPRTRTVVSIVQIMNRENVRSPARYLSAKEFNYTLDDLNGITRAILRRLNAMGVRGVVMNGAFPMDTGRYPGKTWDVSHKIVAVEAGMGRMGLNRLVIHPRCGNFIELASILIDAELDRYDAPLAESPCIDCRLCVAACPVGAVHADGSFDLLTCMTHAYRDNARGFLEWVEAVGASGGDVAAYRGRFRDSETASLWQSLMYGMDYKCGYCMAVCPAGEDVKPEYLGRKQDFMKEVFQPLKDRVEPVYAMAGSEAEARIGKNPNKEFRPAGLVGTR